MLDALAMEERALRRRLLFRLLKDFDFDSPRSRNDLMPDPGSVLTVMQASDHFVFSFGSHGA